MKARRGFCLTSGRGFHVTFENGLTVSVQFGPGNYCDNYDEDFHDTLKVTARGSATAEMAVLGRDGKLMQLEGGDTVTNRSSPAEMLALMNKIAAMPGPEDATALSAPSSRGE